jgi:hypothetical protein
LVKQPVGLAFEANGDLWTTESGFLKQFGSPLTLIGSFSPAPTLTVAVQGIDSGGPVFDPPPLGVPLSRYGDLRTGRPMWAKLMAQL